MPEFQFSGLNLAITTPFDDRGRIDYGRLEQNVERYLDAGIRSFLFSSGTGMHVYLSKDEAEELVKRGAAMVAGRAKVIAQTSALLSNDVVERTKRARDAGADGVMVLPPFFEGPIDDESILDFYAEVCGAGLPVIGYNVPQAVGVAITPELLNRLSAIDGFCGVKDSSGDLAKQSSLIRTGKGVINGADPLVPYALFAGCYGLIWGGANFAPRTCVAVVDAASRGAWAEVRQLWSTVEAAMNLIWEGEYVQSVYAAAELTGYGAGSPRKPLRALSSARLPALREALCDLISREKL
ncbi:dihydrodipicolinate synthase family protein [Rhizobium leguminosarum]|uniref:dihydrodipicolinate synthase family protein n=1 Tax=Rhizobium leguminosarum TaxID=384 RepID=UPI001C97C1EE|nr:dihydrodipicolinate synthase family protein [Rhizobium leguminosarum]MBY5570707.1 dihydrodipicolinate synthase family protein [Rhizobium leguminosarum]MBY5577272.1 dihydrodipicolinate synthase family protein [Rhizobium leguminosarum]